GIVQGFVSQVAAMAIIRLKRKKKARIIMQIICPPAGIARERNIPKAIPAAMESGPPGWRINFK
ncbi:MAG: hypothetical protein U9O87_11465, partial [Verrucomicrobiota bacterium]|nr:hypothetical protein [Verrucomicrobiota bacterium]